MFETVIREFEKVEIDSFVGDEKIIHNILAATGIVTSDLDELSRFLTTQYDVALEAEQVELADKIELLQNGVNSIIEVVHNRYTVTYQSNYIAQYL